MKTVALIGAGCSLGLAKIPADYNFMKVYEQDIKQTNFLLEALERIYGRGQGLDFEQAIYRWVAERLEVCWTEIDENFNHPKIVLKSSDIRRLDEKWMQLAKAEEPNRAKYYSEYLLRSDRGWTPNQILFMFAGWELRKLVLEKLSVQIDEKIYPLYGALIKKLEEVSNRNLLSVTSFNYDTLLEQAFNKIGKKCYYVGPQNRHLNQRGEYGLPIIKPHGSLNWLHKCGEPITLVDERFVRPENIGHINGVLHQHSIIGLVINKREFEMVNEDRAVTNLYRETILPALVEEIRDAEQLLVIGYSFPDGDGHIRGAFFRSKPQKLKKVLVVDKECNEGKIDLIKKRINALLGIDLLSIEWFNEGIENWIK